MDGQNSNEHWDSILKVSAEKKKRLERGSRKDIQRRDILVGKTCSSEKIEYRKNIKTFISQSFQHREPHREREWIEDQDGSSLNYVKRSLLRRRHVG